MAYDPHGLDAEGIMVQKDSKIKKLSDLRGKKIAVQKGSNAHYLLVKALASAKLAPSDVEIAFLKPSEARAAFERKDVDAWSIWDPYLAAAETLPNARLLTTAKGLAPNWGLDVKVLELAERRRKHDALPLNEKVVDKQQDIADTFSELKLIPRPIKVKDAVWIWK